MNKRLAQKWAGLLKWVFIALAIILLGMICIAWNIMWNFSGGYSASTKNFAYMIVHPGEVAAIILSGHSHGGFGDWRDHAIGILFSWFTWLLPLLLIWCVIKKWTMNRKRKPWHPLSLWW